MVVGPGEIGGVSCGHVYTWNLAPSFNETAFTFNPAKDAARVVLAEVH
jgi:hypothetical protein